MPPKDDKKKKPPPKPECVPPPEAQPPDEMSPQFYLEQIAELEGCVERFAFVTIRQEAMKRLTVVALASRHLGCGIWWRKLVHVLKLNFQITRLRRFREARRVQKQSMLS